MSTWILTCVPLYSGLAITEEMDEAAFDPIMFTSITVREKKRKDNNRILHTPGVVDNRVIKRQWVSLQIDFMKEQKMLNSSIIYGCRERGSTIIPENVMSQYPLVDL